MLSILDESSGKSIRRSVLTLCSIIYFLWQFEAELILPKSIFQFPEHVPDTVSSQISMGTIGIMLAFFLVRHSIHFWTLMKKRKNRIVEVDDLKDRVEQLKGNVDRLTHAYEAFRYDIDEVGLENKIIELKALSSDLFANLKVDEIKGSIEDCINKFEVMPKFTPSGHRTEQGLNDRMIDLPEQARVWIKCASGLSDSLLTHRDIVSRFHNIIDILTNFFERFDQKQTGFVIKEFEDNRRGAKEIEALQNFDRFFMSELFVLACGLLALFAALPDIVGLIFSVLWY